jgi:glycosyltransferase involved in cell wall biosynthesis
MNAPLVSIIVPCYNYAHYLGQTLDNLRAQEYQNWECLIVDDGSTDDTAAVAASLVKADGRFRYLHQANKGLSAARNTGISNSKGIYIQFLDSDDFIDVAKLVQQVAILEADKDIDITYGKSLFFFTDDPNKFYPSRKMSGAHLPKKLQANGRGRQVLQKLLVNNIMEVSCALLRKQLVTEVGFFDESYKSYEDWLYWIRCALHNARFDFSPLRGTETYIRCGHQSMMSDKRKLTLHGIRIRRFLHPHLNYQQRLYNFGRLLKLYTRTASKIY